MPPAPIFLTLQSKKQLTYDVYELEYSSTHKLEVLPGQFLLCDTGWDPRLRRSYSISWAEWNRIFFIIKRLTDGKGGSVAICDQEIWHEMQIWWPMGRFVLQKNNCPKVFIGTGTGFAPLYFMIKSHIQSIQNGDENGGLFFVFGVRELRDVFYQEELEQWSGGASFDYQIYCSRETSVLPEKHSSGRVTEFLTQDIISQIRGVGDAEFYICGSPAMVTEVRSMLDIYWISEEKVFFEQY